MADLESRAGEYAQKAVEMLGFKRDRGGRLGKYFCGRYRWVKQAEAEKRVSELAALMLEKNTLFQNIYTPFYHSLQHNQLGGYTDYFRRELEKIDRGELTERNKGDYDAMQQKINYVCWEREERRAESQERDLQELYFGFRKRAEGLCSSGKGRQEMIQELGGLISVVVNLEQKMSQYSLANVQRTIAAMDSEILKITRELKGVSYRPVSISTGITYPIMNLDAYKTQRASRLTLEERLEVKEPFWKRLFGRKKEPPFQLSPAV